MNKKLAATALLIGFPVLALCLGFLLAFIALRWGTLFFVLLPLTAFILGYYSSGAVGALSGFSLFLSYTFATSIMWWEINNSNIFFPWGYIYAFLGGGFTLVVIGALAHKVKNSFRSFAAKAILFITALVTILCSFAAVTHYGYYYQVSLQCSEDLSYLEIYLPIGAVDGKPYVPLLDSTYFMPGYGMTENYTKEMVQTEYGPMLKIVIQGLEWQKSPDLPYTANIMLWQKTAPSELINLMPKYDVSILNSVTHSNSFAGVVTNKSEIVERFKVPIKFIEDKEAKLKITLWNRTDRSAGINFSFSKNTTYTEYIGYEGSTGNGWVFVPVEATSHLEVRGIGD